MNNSKRTTIVLLSVFGALWPAMAHAEVCDKVADSSGGQLLLVIGSLVGAALAAWRPILGVPFIAALVYLAWIQAGDPIRPYAEFEGCGGSLDVRAGLTYFGLALVVLGAAIGCYSRWRLWTGLSRAFTKNQQAVADMELDE